MTKENESLATTQPASVGLMSVAQQREIAEVQSMLIVARSNPRNVIKSKERIKNACSNVELANKALYQYARGGSDITGESIRLAEVIAQNWGNFEFGVRELEQRDGESTVEAYAWDLETNVRQRRTFQVSHKRKAQGRVYTLTDPRDIYEMIANQGARRMRACILAIIPDDVKIEAVEQCEATLSKRFEVTEDLIKSLIEKFKKHGVEKEQIEKRIQRRIDSITPQMLYQLGKIYNSLEDEMSKPADWFDFETPAEDSKDAGKLDVDDLKEKDETKEPSPKISKKAVDSLVKEAQKNNVEQGDLLKIVKKFGFDKLEDITDPPYDEILEAVRR
jgi:hypothetical protein